MNCERESGGWELVPNPPFPDSHPSLLGPGRVAFASLGSLSASEHMFQSPGRGVWEAQ